MNFISKTFELANEDGKGCLSENFPRQTQLFPIRKVIPLEVEKVKLLICSLMYKVEDL